MMKTNRFLPSLIGFCLVLLLLAGFIGCAGPQKPDPNYLAYLKEIKAQREAPREPLLYLTLDSKGQVRDLRVTLPPDRVEIRPYEPKVHPAWSLAGTAIKATASVVGLSIVADAVVDLANNAGHNNYYQDSYNDVGRDYNSIRDIDLQEGDFAPKWDYSTDIRDSYNTDIRDSFHFGSHNSYDLGGDGASLTQGDQVWNLGAMPWNWLE